ncbi:MAG: molybdopterin-synthase adenylyltransferase MoeB [Rhodospirillales bacterium]|nr:molybdopterin-synthase adenylyltransferase MoeB [Rhodospirillales bacterium]MCW8860971.1 molybdopterin-synthase adenylyltransferase MoeB [Rhodospirillales bacterium]MCW8953094.1 molybdopterin-synthase adenylyltransferase MoeB [Rhodospirillales bacterium]MCW8971613.1 molybdopterin-synthase adenylyltransferase MoeB [Rhodospirillales bacterium]MCW9003328.1 molybdopterin-synthase adenylyltransferase MoeB [Rhodospirillales bacterium]
MDFTEHQIQRYARHILLPEVGGTGQAKLLGARVLVVGAGGLGSPMLLYLAAAGVGTIGIVDADVVDVSNLQRQVAHATARVGMPKVESAREALHAINPEVTVVAHNERINVENALDLIGQYDVVADGSDNFATRFLVNDACYFAKRPLVSAAILRFDGQVYTFRAHEEGENRPCYRCIFREPPPPGQIPSCAEAGVLGALCGTVGSLQATEVIKEILGIGQTLAGSLLIYDGLETTFRKVKVKRDPGCPLCGQSPTITDLSIHGQHAEYCTG